MPNRLANETSPYLLQHAHNPVDWYPWGEEALSRARAEDKPILLSVGYSACHWCHVMERESFEDPNIAAVMNQGFINVKVDREERPDLDEIYMQAVQAFTGGRGGWPMTLVLTPDGRPWFGGTYFPPRPVRGMPSFPQVLHHASTMWATRRAEILQVAEELTGHLQSLGRMPAPAEALTDDWLGAVSEAAATDFDPENGGFGKAPKFPAHGTLAVLLAHHQQAGDTRSLEMALESLRAMARGGMYDLLAGGFARYSVDERWCVPHFEKMLYDNGQLIPLYLDAWRSSGQAGYARIARDSLDWALREMLLPEGGFAASQDADSEGEEGRFFVWTPAQLRETLGFMDGMRACTLLGVSDEGNFEHGRSVLRLEGLREELPEADQALLDRALPRLMQARALRVPPGRDDKVIVAWNALMISAMARGAWALNEPKYLQAAEGAARFILDRVTVAGRLRRTWKDGRAGPLACLDDYAGLMVALLDLYEAGFDRRWLQGALALAEQTVDLFRDPSRGGLFFTGRDAEPLIARTRNLSGGAVPSGNGLAALGFARLAALCGREDLGELADEILRSYQSVLPRAARALGVEALAATWRAAHHPQLGVVGEQPQALLAVLRAQHLPFVSVTVGVDPLVPWMEGRGSPDGRATAYLCEGGSCQLPTQDPAELAEQLDAALRPRPPAPRTLSRVHAPELPQDPESWLNSAPLSLKALRGQVVVLDFWTYCCINCLHILPELAAIEQRFAGQPVVVIGVHAAKFPAEQERDNVQRAVARHHIQHPVVLDPKHRVWQEYTVRSWPTVMVLDTQGRIAWAQPGEVRAETLERVIEGLLAEGAAEQPAWTPPAQAPHAAPLKVPGKLATWPDPAAQLRGLDLGDGRLYIADTGNHRVLEAALSLGADGWPEARILRSFGDGQPGRDDGPAPRFREPQGLCSDGSTLYIADTGNHSVRAIDLSSGEVRTLAGDGRLGRPEALDPSQPLRTALRSPWDVAVEEGLLFIAMAGTHQIWVYELEHKRLAPLLGSGQEDHIDGAPEESALAQPSGMVLLGRYLFWVDSETSSVRAFDLAEGEVATLAGAGLFDFGDIDGPAETARLQHPLGITASADALYVADTFNNKIKVFDLAGGSGIRTLAGGPPEALREPGGLAIWDEHLLIADTNGHRLRVMNRHSGELRDLKVEGLRAP